ncbi:MAG: helix-turn-helix transcriptional regulator [Chthoniobacteraceae bacterium]|nr:helix-turn-helix transcriptional regulator [Chthoniobacteraceae bacterium]
MPSPTNALPGGVANLPLAKMRFLQTHLAWAYRGVILPEHCDIHVHDAGVVSARLYLKGGGVFTSERGRAEVGPGQWFFAPETPYHHRVEPGSEYYSIQFRAHWSTGLRLFPSGGFLVAPAKETPALTRAARDLVALIRRHFPGARHRLGEVKASLRVWACLEEQFARWLRHYVELMERLGVASSVAQVTDARVGRALALLADALPRGGLSLQEMARAVGCGRNHFARLFLREVGEPYSTVADRLRLERVLECLETGSGRAKEAAFAAGFASLPHFSRWFRRQTGLSPRAYWAKIAPSKG